MSSDPNFAAILPPRQLQKIVEDWLHDDMPSFDVGALVVSNRPNGTAHLYMKSPGVLAGRPFFDAVFDTLGCTVAWDSTMKDGMSLDPTSSTTASSKIHVATVTGPIAQILQGERTALNTLSRCSGVATAAHRAVTIVRDCGWKGHLAGTRKTTPGFRIVEKYGLLVGGASTHRIDLSQMVMLKDNHIQAAGNISQAVQWARMAAGFSQKIEVECQNLSEALEAASAGADIVMLDNYASPDQLGADATSLKQQYPHVLVEASGGITVADLHRYCYDSVDIISQGSLTQGYDCIDFSLKIV
jgi:nicotinate-nucleotide pyrophosphorylase (carboxylating)